MVKVVVKAEGDTFSLTKSKVKRLKIRNFRCIGPDPATSGSEMRCMMVHRKIVSIHPVDGKREDPTTAES